ncbi:MAG: nucleotidyltransferase domain-containing protein [bacterium]
MIDVSQVHFESIKTILRDFIPNRRVLAFGSRINGKATKHSDLDLVIMGDECVETKTMAMLEYEFQKSEIPFRVDLIEWATTSEAFQKIILSNFIEIQQQ